MLTKCDINIKINTYTILRTVASGAVCGLPGLRGVMLNKEKLISLLNDKNPKKRRRVFKKLIKREEAENKNAEKLVTVKEAAGEKSFAPVTLNTATNYYYSRYTPSLAAYLAHVNDVAVIGVNDYGTVKGFKEFKFAADKARLKYVYGYHAEVKPLFNEDYAVAYSYAVPFSCVKGLQKDLEPVRKIKFDYVKYVINEINKRLKKTKIKLSESDVIKNSEYLFGGAVTEKHVAKVAAKILAEKFGAEKAAEFLTETLKLKLTDDEIRYIGDADNEYILEDTARILGEYIRKKFKCENLSTIKDIVDVNAKYGVITAYKLKIKTLDEGDLRLKCAALKENGVDGVAFNGKYLSGEDLVKAYDIIYDCELIPIEIVRAGMVRQNIYIKTAGDMQLDVAYLLVGSAIAAACGADESFKGKSFAACGEFKKKAEVFINAGKEA